MKHLAMSKGWARASGAMLQWCHVFTVSRALASCCLLLMACEGQVRTPGSSAASPQTAPTDTPLRVVQFLCDARVLAGKPISCVAEGAGPTAVECLLSAGDNTPMRKLGDCRTPVTESFIFDTPGVQTLTLSIVDSRSQSVARDFSVEVFSNQNQPPAILSVTGNPTRGPAPLNTALSFEVSDADGDALTCSIDIGNDGTEDIAAFDCAETPKQVTLSQVGPSLVKLTVTDAAGQRAEKILALEITEPGSNTPANRIPVIVSFSSNPVAGLAPLQTTLSFNVTDADDQALTCSIDIDADGSVEVAPFDCAAKSKNVTLPNAGKIKILLKASDGVGAAVERELTVDVQNKPPTMSVGDLKIGSIEFGQIILSEKLRLVEGKPALLRVTALATQNNVAATVEVEAKLGQTSLGIKAMDAPQSVPLAEAPFDLSKSFRLQLPLEWIKPDVSLTIRVDANNALSETDENNNTRTVALDVGRSNTLHLTKFSLVSGGETGNGDAIDFPTALMARWPLSAVETKTRPPVTLNFRLTDDVDTWSRALDIIESIREMDGSRRNYFGVTAERAVGGLAFRGGNSALARDASRFAIVHELGHNFGLQHAPCGGAGNPDPNFPNRDGSIISRGIDGTKVINPSQVFDIMGYCDPDWISEYYYAKAQKNLEQRREFSSDPLAFAAAVTNDALLISGTLTATGVHFAPVQRIQSTVSAPVESDTKLTLSTSEGKRFEVPVSMRPLAEGNAQSFAVVVAYPGTLSAVSLSHGRDVLGNITAKAPLIAPAATAERIDEQRVRVHFWGGEFASVAHLRSLDSMGLAAALNFEETLHTTLTVGATGGETVVRVDGLEPGELEVSVSNGLQSEVIRLPMPLVKKP